MPTEEAITFRPSDILTLDQISRKEKCAHGTVWVWVLRGRLKAHLIAGRYLVLRSDYEEFCRDRQTAASLTVATG